MLLNPRLEGKDAKGQQLGFQYDAEVVIVSKVGLLSFSSRGHWASRMSLFPLSMSQEGFW